MSEQNDSGEQPTTPPGQAFPPPPGSAVPPQQPSQPTPPPAPQQPAAPAWGAPQQPGPQQPSQPTPPPAPQVPGYGAPTPPPPAPGVHDAPSPGGYGAPPAPGSAYPGPQQGGFPPPPGGFPPPPQGVPAAPYAGGGYQAQSDIGGAFSWGWSTFKQNAGVLIGSLLLWGVAVGIIFGIGYAIAGAAFGTATATTTDAGFTAASSFGFGGIIFVSILGMLAAFVAQVAITNGVLVIADRGRAQLGDFFKFRNVGQGILLAVLMGLASGLLSFTGIGSIAVGFFGAFAFFFVVDRNVGAIDAIKGSVRMALDNAGVTIVAVLVSGAGALVCGVGALITAPLALLVLVLVYRRSTGGQVAA